MAELPYGAATANGWERTGAGCGKVEFTGAGSGKVDIYIDCITTSQKKEKTTAENLSANEWISVKDRLPEDDRNVLVYDDHDIQFWVAWHDECHNNWYTQEGERVYGVTHWMWLPQLPKGE